MAASIADVQALPGLETVADATVQVFLDYAAEMVNAADWGTRHTQAQTLMAAHLLTSARTGGGGAVISETAGPVSRSYAAPAAGAGDMQSTAYGRMYERLRLGTATQRGPVVARMLD